MWWVNMNDSDLTSQNSFFKVSDLFWDLFAFGMHVLRLAEITLVSFAV